MLILIKTPYHWSTAEMIALAILGLVALVLGIIGWTDGYKNNNGSNDQNWPPFPLI